ncbi:hypothetical protein GCM10011385_22400 [Nitratireductor aestuarii]|uniref:Uncharacterized protein n=1 Tax=Nitratireductor aestuarii TaxID=1735103 RepID=A0A916RVB6_9HYPH|nr:hypothetical protein GCM10011385_22400 [Nitratireductor aestuarii]
MRDWLSDIAAVRNQIEYNDKQDGAQKQSQRAFQYPLHPHCVPDPDSNHAFQSVNPLWRESLPVQ